MLIFIVLCHIGACLWIIIAGVYESPNGGDIWDDTWVAAGDFQNEEQNSLYVASIYYTVSTITTVGYGDISGSNMLERIYATILMLIGVISFSFANGSLASIISNSD